MNLGLLGGVLSGAPDRSRSMSGRDVPSGSFGIGLAIVAVILGSYFWRRRGEMPESA
jgi:hypothetical protein